MCVYIIQLIAPITYRFRSNIDPANDIALPIIEAHELIRTHAEQRATKDTLCREVRPDDLGLLEVLEYLDLGGALPHSIRALLRGPNEFECRSKALVPQSQRRVYDVLAIATYNNETSYMC